MNMITEPPIQPVLHNSLSRFSTELNKANSLTDIQIILQNNVKNLFSCFVCRITYFEQNNFVCYTVTNETSTVVTGEKQLLWDVEKLLFCEGLPLRLNVAEHEAILSRIPCESEIDKLWGWKLNYCDDAGILLTILTDEKRPFSRKHIPLIKMIGEMLFTKMRLIHLLQTTQKPEVTPVLTNKQLEESQVVLNELVNMQEKIIDERSQELTLFNKQLTDISQFDFHYIREPLTRIIGLMQLKPLISDEEFFRSCWPMLVASVQDLESRLKEIIIKSEII
jgi:hypothetical protein